MPRSNKPPRSYCIVTPLREKDGVLITTPVETLEVMVGPNGRTTVTYLKCVAEPPTRTYTGPKGVASILDENKECMVSFADLLGQVYYYHESAIDFKASKIPRGDLVKVASLLVEKGPSAIQVLKW